MQSYKIFLVFILMLVIPFISSTPITLNDFNIISNQTFCINGTSTISIFPYDINNSFAPLDYITFQISPNINYTEIKPFSSGLEYDFPIIFNLQNNTNVSNYNVSITVSQQGKQITKFYNYTFITCNNPIDNSINNISNFISENTLVIIFVIVVILFIVIIIILLSLSNKKG